MIQIIIGILVLYFFLKFIMENMNKEWNRFMLEIQKSTEIVDELSKLYIVLHQKVRKTISKCTLDPQYDPTQQAHQHLQTILDLLNRLSDPNDAYLKGVDPSILNKYEQQLVDLSQQIQKLLKGQKMAQSYDAKQLIGLRQADNRQKFGLKGQIKESQNRILRSRSGKRTGTLKQGKERRGDNRLIEQYEAYRRQYLKKKARLQKQIENHIQKKDNQIIFTKKYAGDNLEHYFKLRKQLLNLVLAQQHTKEIVSTPNYSILPKHQNNEEGFEEKIFNEFKIKTKYMKKHVKENILEALADVKLKLLQQYHSSNISKLNQANPDTLIVLVNKNKSQSMATLPSKTQSKPFYNQSQAKPSQTAKQSSSLQNKNKNSSAIFTGKQQRYPMASKSSRPRVYEGGWDYEMQQGYKKGIIGKLSMYRVAN